jgi:hypothetical protein
MWTTGQKAIVGLKANVKTALDALTPPTDPNEAAQMSAAVTLLKTHIDGIATNGVSVSASGSVNAGGARLNFNVIPTPVVD